MDEHELLNEAKLGNKAALNTLLSENLKILKGYVIKMTGDPTLSQDIVQDTLLKAVININRFQPNAKFSTWLIKIATNVYRDYLRRNRTVEELDDSVEYKGQTPEDSVISKLEYREIMKIILKLSPEKRSVFILKHYHGYKYEEIAQIVNCPVGTVRSRLHNAVKFIICELERREII